ncbi:MAG TPA: hypothetical protein VHY10_08770 [Xanthobacteraceae bacterium]|jgi:hypothetical protein|nr:hypothetical protein [Xanthobacteraceae bacterium]
MASPSQLERVLAALDDALADQVKSHFAGICLQIDSDGAGKAGANAAHFELGLRDVLAAYDAACAIAAKVIGGTT